MSTASVVPVPDYDELVRDGRPVEMRIGRQVYDLGGRFYVAVWVTRPGTPRWVVSPAADEEPAGGEHSPPQDASASAP